MTRLHVGTKAIFAVCLWFALRGGLSQVRLASAPICREVSMFATRMFLVRPVARFKSCCQRDREPGNFLFLPVNEDKPKMLFICLSLERQNQARVSRVHLRQQQDPGILPANAPLPRDSTLSSSFSPHCIPCEFEGQKWV